MAASRTANIFDQHNPQSVARDSAHASLPTPPSISASNSSHYSPEGQFKVVRRRNRVPLSCAPCRSRKLKCNRSQPCENCVKRGDAMSCSYAQPSNRKRQNISTQEPHSPDDMQHRIDRLEGLVLSLMTNGNDSAGPMAAARALSVDSSSGSVQYPQDVDIDGTSTTSIPPRQEGSEESDTDQVAQSLGVMKVDNTKSMYIGASHWAALLSDISEIKNFWTDHKKQFDDQFTRIQETKARMDSSVSGPMFWFGGAKVPDFSEVLAQMPKRAVADKLVSRYFNSYDPAVHILHPQSWYRIYEKHWANPQASTPAWVGQMFAILCLAMHSYHRMDDEPAEYKGKSLSLATHYRTLTGQCLLLADFTKPLNYMIETMVLHLHCEYARTRDTEVGVWVMAGMIVRLAMRMGYHRDPKYYSNISPFQGEIRRRVWTFVRQSDLLFSFQVGLPSMIRQGDCDTELPRNLFDEDFDESSPGIPQSRPNTEPTPVSYMRAKAIMSFAFGRVVERLHLVTNCTYEDILEMDQNLRECLAELPPHLRMKSLEESVTDPSALIMQRFNLSILYHKGQCVLHRKFLTKARESNRYAQSRRTCIDSSMELLNHQSTLHYESRPNHRLHAAMIVALDLHYGSESDESAANSNDLYMWGAERRSDMIRALEVSREIWKETSDQSIEAYKATALLTVMLDKLKSRDVPQNKSSQNPFPFPGMSNGSDGGQPFGVAPVEEKPEHSAAVTLGMLSSGGMSGSGAGQYIGQYASTGGDTSMSNVAINSGAAPGYTIDPNTGSMQNGVSNFGGIFGGAIMPGMDSNEANIDWDAWDSFLQNANIEPTVNQQAHQQQNVPQQQNPWPSSVDPSLAAAAIDNQKQSNGANFSAANAFLGANLPF